MRRSVEGTDRGQSTLFPEFLGDWICVSPKSDSELAIRKGNELKLVYPQADGPPETFAHLAFEQFLLQPMEGLDVAENARRAIQYYLEHPQWQLSLQTHKLIGIR